MENLTLEEIELALTAISQWEREFRISGENWDDVDALEKKLERMKERRPTQRALDSASAAPQCKCDGKYYHADCKLVYQAPPSH